MAGIVNDEAIVNVRAVQKSLNEMSRNEWIEFIRASGDPRGGASRPATPTRPIYRGVHRRPRKTS